MPRRCWRVHSRFANIEDLVTRDVGLCMNPIHCFREILGMCVNTIRLNIDRYSRSFRDLRNVYTTDPEIERYNPSFIDVALEDCKVESFPREMYFGS